MLLKCKFYTINTSLLCSFPTNLSTFCYKLSTSSFIWVFMSLFLLNKLNLIDMTLSLCFIMERFYLKLTRQHKLKLQNRFILSYCDESTFPYKWNHIEMALHIKNSLINYLNLFFIFFKFIKYFFSINCTTLIVWTNITLNIVCGDLWVDQYCKIYLYLLFVQHFRHIIKKRINVFIEHINFFNVIMLM